jgi:phosphoenolpyruvate mutase
MKNKTVFTSMEADVIHSGNLNIINKAKNLGSLIVGLFTDQAIADIKRAPLLCYNERVTILENIKGIKKIVPLESIDFSKQLRQLKPDIVVHGDDWKKGINRSVRDNVINVLKEWNGKLVEIPYTKGISTTDIINKINQIGTSPIKRLSSLRKLLDLKPILKFMEAHNGLTGLIVENAEVELDNKIEQFDGIWLSSLTLSTVMAKPDNELVDFTSKFRVLEEIIEVTTKPIIVDGDTGGEIAHFGHHIKTLERLGVSAIIIEDKKGLKKNSLFGTDVFQEQESIENFCLKIKEGKNSSLTDDFLIFARIESLILKKGMDDALLRADEYINSGADGIMIHSKEQNVNEIATFCNNYNKFNIKVPLIVVPSSFSSVTEKELKALGVNIVIYGNHLLRAAYPSMVKTAELILRTKRCKEASKKYCMSIKDIINLIPE